MTQPIANHKRILSAFAPEGWRYTGFDGEFYLYQTGSYANGFKEMQLIEEDLTKENIELMAKLGMTRV